MIFLSQRHPHQVVALLPASLRSCPLVGHFLFYPHVVSCSIWRPCQSLSLSCRHAWRARLLVSIFTYVYLEVSKPFLRLRFLSHRASTSRSGLVLSQLVLHPCASAHFSSVQLAGFSCSVIPSLQRREVGGHFCFVFFCCFSFGWCVFGVWNFWEAFTSKIVEWGLVSCAGSETDAWAS
jgi:hypothetical protein